jgi:hypothetical protein
LGLVALQEIEKNFLFNIRESSFWTENINSFITCVKRKITILAIGKALLRFLLEELLQIFL